MYLIILQILIIIAGVSAKLLVGSRGYGRRRRGYMVGIVSEFLWLGLFIHQGLPLMVVLCFLYAVAWCTGLYRHPKQPESLHYIGQDYWDKNEKEYKEHS